MKVLKYFLVTLVLLLLGVFLFTYKADIPVEKLKEKYANSASKFVVIDGLNVHYRDEGNRQDSTPIVLIHGTGASLHTWEEWVKDLAQTRRVVTFDLPAYGLTGPNATGNYSLAYYATFLEQFLSALQVSRCVLGGNSLGGAITWYYTLQYPQRVQKMILVDAGGYPMQSKSVPVAFQMARIPVIRDLFKYILPYSIVEKSVKNVYVQQAKITPELIQRYYDLALREGNRKAFVDRMQLPLQDSTFLKIKTLQQPTLILWGEQDGLIPTDVAYKFQRDLPNDTLVILKNLGHTPMEEDPQTTLKVVEAFLKK